MRTPQFPIGSPFNAGSTALEVVARQYLTGKVAIVTGGSSGIGVETTRALGSAGACVIVPARDLSRAANVLDGMQGVEIEQMDLLDPASIDAFAKRFLETKRPLHFLINSAGIMATPCQRDSRGYEIQFATNHLGHFQLTKNLLPALKSANGARIVSLSSAGHRFSPVVFDDIQFNLRTYDPFAAYGQSKTANVLFAVEADRRLQGDGIRAFAVHPGTIVGTSLGRHVSNEQLKNAGVIDEDGRPIIDPSRGMKNVEQGASTSVWCAVSPKLHGMGGVYCVNCEIAPLIDPTSMTAGLGSTRPGVLPYAVDPQAASQLWELSETLLG